MTKNHIKLAQAVQTEVARGMPDGLSEEFLRKIPMLFNRIEELERALIPFARAFDTNKQYNKTMLDVYKKDCQAAFNMLDSTQSIVPSKKFEYPA